MAGAGNGMPHAMESTVVVAVDATTDEHTPARQVPAPDIEDNCLEDTLLMPAQHTLQLVGLPSMSPRVGPKAMRDWPVSSDLRPPIV